MTQPQQRGKVSSGNKLKRTRVTYIFSHDPKGPEEMTLGLKRMFGQYLSLIRCLKENESVSDSVKFQFCHLNHILSYIPTTLISVSGWGNNISLTFKFHFTSCFNRDYRATSLVLAGVLGRSTFKCCYTCQSLHVFIIPVLGVRFWLNALHNCA